MTVAVKKPLMGTRARAGRKRKATEPTRSLPPQLARPRSPKPGALSDAAQFGTEADVKAALASGADVNECVGTRTPLGMACFHRKVASVRALLAAGASPTHSAPHGSPPIVLAVTSGSKRTEEMLQMLLDAGADPDPPAYRDMTLIEWCRFDPKLTGYVAVLERAAAARKHSR
jgi:ankyrin repeat protein